MEEYEVTDDDEVVEDEEVEEDDEVEVDNPQEITIQWYSMYFRTKNSNIHL